MIFRWRCGGGGGYGGSGASRLVSIKASYTLADPIFIIGPRNVCILYFHYHVMLGASIHVTRHLICKGCAE